MNVTGVWEKRFEIMRENQCISAKSAFSAKPLPLSICNKKSILNQQNGFFKKNTEGVFNDER